MKIKANDYTSSEIFKTVREWTELTQTEFGDTVGTTRSGIAKYENGDRKFTFETFLKICNKHGISIYLEKKK